MLKSDIYSSKFHYFLLVSNWDLKRRFEHILTKAKVEKDEL